MPLYVNMDIIFHEKQEGSLCAQHCLNNLLQGSYFSPIDLADIAKQLDETERETMAEAGVETAEYQHFMEQPSNNYDDSGFFSIQVIETALAVWNIRLAPITSSDPVARVARSDPRSQQAYICNFREHWFTIRKLGRQWFNLNSTLSEPELITDTYLQLFLKQLETDGYSIFIVLGTLPECEADQVLSLCPAVQTVKPRHLGSKQSILSQDSKDEDLEKALQASNKQVDNEDTSLKAALAMSLKEFYGDIAPLETLQQFAHGPSTSKAQGSGNSNPQGTSTSQAPASIPTPSAEAIRQQRMQYFDKKMSGKIDSMAGSDSTSTHTKDQQAGSVTSGKDIPPTTPKTTTTTATNINEMSEEEMLSAALKLSMEGLQEGEG